MDRLYNGILVQTTDLRRSFGSGSATVPVLRGIDLAVQAGEMVALYGPSGSGKTTLLNLIGALDRPTAGTISLCGQDILRLGERRRAKLRRQRLGFIFQNYTLMPSYTSAENIDLALRLPGLWVWERRKRIRAALEAVGLSAWANHLPDQLSGGQRQRVAIARALALRPAIILADEPTSGLDTRMARRVLGLFHGIARAQGTAFLIVSHDPMIADFVDTTYDLQEGTLHRRQPPAAPHTTTDNASATDNATTTATTAPAEAVLIPSPSSAT
ncbi:MAG: ABC transporter ATP-binding protein [Anaerolineae bacterium]|nr:ABC transporter ATP-binding protein [Anaerolineae bacterium]